MEENSINADQRKFEDNFTVSDEEAICVMQLKRLKDKALVADLTLEEARKTEIYIKGLNLIKGTSKKVPEQGKPMSNEELLKLVDGALGE